MLAAVSLTHLHQFIQILLDPAARLRKESSKLADYIVMNEDERSKIVDAWIAHAEFGRNDDGQPTESYEENWWAAERVIN